MRQETVGEFSSDDDDDILLELGTRPPRFTQIPPSSAALQTQIPTALEVTTTTLNNKQSKNDNQLVNQLNKAQGEASMLRDKINFLNIEREKEKNIQAVKVNELQVKHLQELAKLKQELQKLEDEKKFLQMEARGKSKREVITNVKPPSTTLSTNTNTITPDSSSVAIEAKPQSPQSKKRKISDNLLKKNMVPLNPNRIIPDETSLFLESILLHQIIGADLSTIEILNRLKLDYITEFKFKNFVIAKGAPIGKSIVSLLLRCKKTLTLDRFIDTLLEDIAVLIKEISVHPNESKLAVPFLVALMYQVVQFRPSATHNLALKDCFLFICDLIRIYHHVLKVPIHESNMNLHVEPQIFQYELIDYLIISYSFDLLEGILRVLQSHPKQTYMEFFDENILKSFEFVYKLALTISYKPMVNVIFSAVEVVNIITSIVLNMDNSSDLKSLISGSWWRDCITRLYALLEKEIKSGDVYNENVDTTTLHMSKYHDFFGLIRNIGDNELGGLISKLIYTDRLQSVPRVISKEDIGMDSDKFTTPIIGYKMEKWLLKLKDEVLNIFENLLMIYGDDATIVNGEMLIHSSKFLSREQALMIERYVGQDSPNLDLRCHLIEHTLTIIYRLWKDHFKQLREEQIKQVESQLIMSLWRFLVCQTETVTANEREMRDHRHLVDSLHDLTIKDQASYYEDAFEDLPEYIEEELKMQLNKRTGRIMQVKYDEKFQEMARTILESKSFDLTTLEEADSLYISMGL
ncbi:CEQ_1a_G0012280.mRNA.1.CDS.1 [Saccharomyces cerevisiae]|nr:CEQ_1a_G0012280.mRNA.1.CDS.1 [Saccharomyces cerevisiae]CAI7219690.1 CEQ_1a_G0012280.mRNA.1.CDS.1 [Saccharomyces cerevisiae]